MCNTGRSDSAASSRLQYQLAGPQRAVVAELFSLSPLQCRLLEAELGPKLALTHRDKASVTNEILKLWCDGRVIKGIDDFFKRYAKNMVVPQGKEKRVEALFEVCKGL